MGERHPSVALAMQSLAKLINVPRQDYVGADLILTEALEIYRSSYSRDRPGTATALNSPARLQLLQGKIASADPLFHEAIAMRKAVIGETKNITVRTATEFSDYPTSQNRYSEAESLLLSVLSNIIREEIESEIREKLYDLYQSWGKSDKKTSSKNSRRQQCRSTQHECLSVR